MNPKKYKKLDPKIIRDGDIVKIINPITFVRCGYPLGIEDMRKEVQEKFGPAIDNLYVSVQSGDKLIQKDMIGEYEYGLKIDSNPSKKYKHFEIVNALAYARLYSKGFGGKERNLHTKTIEGLKDKEAQVISIEIVKTGTYIKGSGRVFYYDGDCDYEPSYLANSKTHKILTLDIFEPNTTGNWLPSKDFIKIEAIHVEKLPSMQETPYEYEHRMRHTIDKKEKEKA